MGSSVNGKLGALPRKKRKLGREVLRQKHPLSRVQIYFNNVFAERRETGNREPMSKRDGKEKQGKTLLMKSAQPLHRLLRMTIIKVRLGKRKEKVSHETTPQRHLFWTSSSSRGQLPGHGGGR